MSLESALDEERREVMALLENRPPPPRASSVSARPRAASPVGAAQSPVRSMLDIGPAPAARHASIAGVGRVGVTSPTSSMFPQSPPVRSMLDTASPPPHGRNTSQTRQSMSPPPTTRTLGSPRINPESQYQFEMLPSIDSHAAPKRVSQGGKKGMKGAMSQVFGSGGGHDDFNSFQGNRGRHNSTSGVLGRSMSPSARLPGRSSSPGPVMLNKNSSNWARDPTKYTTESGKVIDMKNAYRKLSDAKLLRSGGDLSTLAHRKGSDVGKGESLAPDGGVRLEKDEFDGDEEAVETSDEDNSDMSSDGEDWDERQRGRRRRRASNKSDQSNASPDIDGAKKPKSLLAAAEEERKTLSSKYRYRSLLEPTINVTGPNGEKMMAKKTGVHPNTSFDQGGGSAVSTPVNSDTEADLDEIRRAQKLGIDVTPIHSSPEAHRCIRTIIRGDYATLQNEAEQGLRRQRVYLVATDLSEEAAYALEWTIGTVLRDGDTLLAVYAVDEELGTGGEAGIDIGQGASVMKDTASLVKVLSNEQQARVASSHGASPGPSPLNRSSMAGESDEKPDPSTMRKTERERWHATQEVSDRCVKLLRKTKLQVRVVVEVFHCKSPKHMITEVIDYLEPTLVILGSRGRSALKGVLLGSFSNYLVTKSSVPVMVARKRLRKHSKYKRTNLRLSNVLTNPNGKLASAKID